MTVKPKAKAKPAPSRRRDSRPIVRTNPAGAWWCPFCDRSHESKQGSCDGCGAVRDGDEVTSAR